MSKTFTAEQRQKIEGIIAEARAQTTPIYAEINPKLADIRGIENLRDKKLEDMGLDFGGDDIERCEGCYALILPGDKYSPTFDSGPLCEECSPTLGDLRAMFARDPSEFEDPESAAEYIASRADEPDETKTLFVHE